MTRPYSNDLRERVVLAFAAGESCRAVASRFGVSVSSVVKWSQRYRATGSVSPGRMGGHRRRVLEEHRNFIIDQIKRTPHRSIRNEMTLPDVAWIKGYLGDARCGCLASSGMAGS